MTRRWFLGRLCAAAVGLTLATKLPGIGPSVLALPEIAAEPSPLKAGDVFTIAGVYQVNFGRLQEFVVVSSDGTGVVMQPKAKA